MKAKHNGKEVLITYVSADMMWALITQDLENKRGVYKVDIIELDDYDQFQLEELSQKRKGY